MPVARSRACAVEGRVAGKDNLAVGSATKQPTFGNVTPYSLVNVNLPPQYPVVSTNLQCVTKFQVFFAVRPYRWITFPDVSENTNAFRHPKKRAAPLITDTASHATSLESSATPLSEPQISGTADTSGRTAVFGL